MARILVVDDEADIVTILKRMLTKAGHDVETAMDGEAALAILMLNRPDLVICDVNMPKMNGRDVLAEVRGDAQRYGELPFMFLTGMSDRTDVIAARREGADDYLTKPIDFDLLLATVESRLAQVARMRAVKEAQLVKLYRALTTPEPAEEAAPKEELPVFAISGQLKIAIVSGPGIDLDKFGQEATKRGHALYKIASGKILIDRLATVKPHVVVMALKMPDLPASGVLKLFKSRGADGTPVVLVVPPGETAGPGADWTKDQIDGNIVDVVVSPVDASALADKLPVLAGMMR